MRKCDDTGRAAGFFVRGRSVAGCAGRGHVTVAEAEVAGEVSVQVELAVRLRLHGVLNDVEAPVVVCDDL